MLPLFLVSLVGGLFTLGGAVTAPWWGRFTDQRGIRFTLTITCLVETTFWLAVRSSTVFKTEEPQVPTS